MMIRAMALTFLTVATTGAHAAGDFPLASCKGWNGTIVERQGIDTGLANMRGVITKVDIQEYCERDPGGETRQYGGKLTIHQCIDLYFRAEGRATMSAQVNCRNGMLSYQYGGRISGHARFPLKPNADTSCASGVPPMMQQFKILCPTVAKRLKVDG